MIANIDKPEVKYLKHWSRTIPIKLMFLMFPRTYDIMFSSPFRKINELFFVFSQLLLGMFFNSI